MKRTLSSSLVLTTVCSIAFACSQPPREEALAERYAHVTDEAADLKIRIHELEEKAATLGLAKEVAERDAHEWRDRSGELEKKLHTLQPEVLPSFQSRDLENNQIVLQRVYSIRTGNCFNERGHPSCLCLQLDESGSASFVVYKSNRVFPETSKPPKLHNNYGQSLSLVTSDIAKAILDWEEKNQDRQIRLESY
jgi:hypothetical protein